MLFLNTILQGRYRVIRHLGQGGMGTIYEALNQRVSAIVALKETIVGDNEEARRAFEREAALLANLHHQSLPKVMDYFIEDGGEYLVMEYIPGHDLAELLELRGAPFEALRVLGWADKLLQVLEYLHGRPSPILHRDIKPSNLKLTREGELFLLDFGLAKGAAGQMPTLLTSRSVRGYTPVYASLEQIYGKRTDTRSDLYSLGATLYHLLTNVPPVDAPTRFDALEDEKPDPLRPPREINSQLHPAISAAIQQAMSVRRKHRYASATEMRLALRHAGEQSHQAEEQRLHLAAEQKRREQEQRRRAEEEAARRRAEEEQRRIETEEQRLTEEKIEQVKAAWIRLWDEQERRRIEEKKRRAEEKGKRTEEEARQPKKAEAARIQSEPEEAGQQRRAEEHEQERRPAETETLTPVSSSPAPAPADAQQTLHAQPRGAQDSETTKKPVVSAIKIAPLAKIKNTGSRLHATFVQRMSETFGEQWRGVLVLMVAAAFAVLTLMIRQAGIGGSQSGNENRTTSILPINANQSSDLITADPNSNLSGAEVGSNNTNTAARSSNTSSTELIDKYGDLHFKKEERVKLDRLALYLLTKTELTAYIVVYAARIGPAGQAQAKADQAKDYLANLNVIDPGRIITIDGGCREELTVELWIAPQGAPAVVADTAGTVPCEPRTTRRGS